MLRDRTKHGQSIPKTVHDPPDHGAILRAFAGAAQSRPARMALAAYVPASLKPRAESRNAL